MNLLEWAAYHTCFHERQIPNFWKYLQVLLIYFHLGFLVIWIWFIKVFFEYLEFIFHENMWWGAQKAINNQTFYSVREIFFFQIFWFCFCFLRTKWVNKNKTYISVSCSPNVFTKNEFRIFTNHNSSCLCLLIISIWFMKFFLWKFGILFSWKYVVRSTRINKKKVLGLNKAFEMVTKIRIWGEGFFLL